MTDGDRLVDEITDVLAAHIARTSRMFDAHEARMRAISETQTHRTNETLAQLRLALGSQGRA